MCKSSDVSPLALALMHQVLGIGLAIQVLDLDLGLESGLALALNARYDFVFDASRK